MGRRREKEIRKWKAKIRSTLKERKEMEAKDSSNSIIQWIIAKRAIIPRRIRERNWTIKLFASNEAWLRKLWLSFLSGKSQIWS